MCELDLSSSVASDRNVIIIGYRVKTSQQQPRQLFSVSEDGYKAYNADNWALFPSLDRLKEDIAELEKLHQGPCEEVNRDSLNRKVEGLKTIGEDDSFTLLKGKDCEEFTDFPGSFTKNISLPLDRYFLWRYETDRFRKVVESWGSSEDHEFLEEIRNQLKAAEWLEILDNRIIEEYTEECNVWKSLQASKPKEVSKPNEGLKLEGDSTPKEDLTPEEGSTPKEGGSTPQEGPKPPKDPMLLRPIFLPPFVTALETVKSQVD